MLNEELMVLQMSCHIVQLFARNLVWSTTEFKIYQKSSEKKNNNSVIDCHRRWSPVQFDLFFLSSFLSFFFLKYQPVFSLLISFYSHFCFKLLLWFEFRIFRRFILFCHIFFLFGCRFNVATQDSLHLCLPCKIQPSSLFKWNSIDWCLKKKKKKVVSILFSFFDDENNV